MTDGNLFVITAINKVSYGANRICTIEVTTRRGLTLSLAMPRLLVKELIVKFVEHGPSLVERFDDMPSAVLAIQQNSGPASED